MSSPQSYYERVVRNDKEEHLREQAELEEEHKELVEESARMDAVEAPLYDGLLAYGKELRAEQRKAERGDASSEPLTDSTSEDVALHFDSQEFKAATAHVLKPLEFVLDSDSEAEESDGSDESKVLECITDVRNSKDATDFVSKIKNLKNLQKTLEECQELFSTSGSSHLYDSKTSLASVESIEGLDAYDHPPVPIRAFIENMNKLSLVSVV
jgi:hypothetical protein